MKNNKISLLFVMVAMLGVGFFSCKEDWTEEDSINLNHANQVIADSISRAQQLADDEAARAQKVYDDSVARAQGLMDAVAEYTVLVVDAANTTTLKSAKAASALPSVTVTLSQNGETITQTTDASGMAVFTDLKQGTIAVNLVADGYSEVNYVALLSSTPNSGNVVIVSEQVPGGLITSNIIPMIPVDASTGTIKGQVTYEADLTNDTAEVAAGVQLVATVDVYSDAFSGIKSGNIQQITYSDLTLIATTDANGKFEMAVPSTASGLDYSIKVSDFEADQTLYMNSYKGVDAVAAADYLKTVPTVFGSNGNYSSSISVPEVLITIAPPSGAKAGTGAAATAILGNNNGISSINITNFGSKYASPSWSYYYLTVPKTSNTYEADLTVAVSDSMIRTVEVDYEGTGYTAGPITFNHQFEAYSATLNVNGTGVITGINVVNRGQFLMNDPSKVTVKIASTTGTGGSLSVSYFNFSDSYYPGTLTINSGGTGYKVTDKVTIEVATAVSSVAGVGNINLSAGYLYAIAVGNAGSGYTSGKVLVELIGGGGVNATATANVIEGKIAYMTVNNSGYGYTSAPTVVIHDLNIPEQPTSLKLESWDLNDNGSLDFTSKYINSGSGYTVAPLVTIDAIGAGSGATAISTIDASGKVTYIYVTNAGSGYNAENYVGSTPSYYPVETTISGQSTSIANIYLGQGKRSIEQ